jgi:lambda family phage tail tape measure protein
MSDEIGRGVVRIEGDTGEFEASMASAKQAAQDAERGITDSMGKIGSSMDAGADQVADAGTRIARSTEGASDGIVKLDQAQQRLIATLERQSARLTMSNADYAQWRATKAGVIDQADTFIQKMREEERASKMAADVERELAEAQRDQARAKASNDNYVAELRNRALAATMTKAAYDDLQAAQRGVSAETEKYRELLKQEALGAKMAADAERELAQAKKEADKAAASQAGFIAELKRMADQAGKTRTELLQMQAAQLGVADQAAPMIAQLKRMEEGHARAGMSAKQHAQAMRLLPAQLTDVVTSLAGGQPAYMVLIQQGGQIKDMFGGIGNAARAIVGAITLANVAMAGLAGGIVAVGKAWYDGAAEAEAYSRALFNTGNALGVTTAQLGDLARAVGESSGWGQGKAAEAIGQLAASGNIAYDSMTRVGQAITEVSASGQRDAKDMVKEFEELGKRPVEASLKLTETHKYLTLTIYEQIKALEQNGQTAQAAALAQQTWADEQLRRNAQVVASLGSIQTAWMWVQKAASNAWSAMLNIGREVSPKEAFDKAQAAFVAASTQEMPKSLPGGMSETQWRARQAEVMSKARADMTAASLLWMSEEDNRRSAALASQTRDAGVAASSAIDARLASNLTKAEQKTKALEQHEKQWNDRRAAMTQEGKSWTSADDKMMAADRAGIEKRFEEKAGRASRAAAAYQEPASQKLLDRLLQQEAVLDAQLTISEGLTDAAKERIKFEREMDALEGRKDLTKEQKSLLASREAVVAQYNKLDGLQQEIGLRKTISDAEKKNAEDEAKAAEDRQKRIDAWATRWRQLQQQMVMGNQDRRDKYDRQIDAFGKGDRLREQLNAEEEIRRDYRRKEREYIDSSPADILGTDEYKAHLDRIRGYLADSLRDHEDYYRRLGLAQSDWLNGANQAFANYLDGTRNVAEQTQRVFGNALSGMENTLTDFFAKGKADWKSFGNAIVADITRVIVRAQMITPITQWMQGSSNAQGGLLNMLISGLFGARSMGMPTPNLDSVIGSSVVSNGMGGFVPALAMGGVVGPSGIDAFANGGVVTQPTFFGYSGGRRTGLMGEAGYEAIMPVARNASGELGVKVTGDAAPRSGDTVVINLNGFRGDAGDLRRSSSQIASRITSELGRARRVM